jgi:hypothetical protein
MRSLSRRKVASETSFTPLPDEPVVEVEQGARGNRVIDCHFIPTFAPERFNVCFSDGSGIQSELADKSQQRLFPFLEARLLRIVEHAAHEFLAAIEMRGHRRVRVPAKVAAIQ